MSERTKKFQAELDQLINDGQMLMLAMQRDCQPAQFRKLYLEVFKGDKDKLSSLERKMPNFKEKYQEWYSKAQAVIRQIMPGRLADFNS